MPRIPNRLGKLKHVTELNMERNRIKVVDEKPILELGHLRESSYRIFREISELLR